MLDFETLTAENAELEKSILYTIQSIAPAFARAVTKEVQKEVQKAVQKAAQKEAAPMSALQKFLSSSHVFLRDQPLAVVYCREKVFIEAFNKYCRHHGYPQHKWDPDLYLGPFSQYDIYIERKKRRQVGGKSVHGTFIVGVELARGRSADLETREPTALVRTIDTSTLNF